MNEIEAVIETGIHVNDLDLAEAFYRDVLGLVVIGKEPGRHVFFRVGQRNVLLVFNPTATLKGDMLPAHGTTGPGHFALGISAADLDAWRERLLAHRVVIEKEVHWPRGGRSLYFRDPAGNSAELITPGCWGLSSGGENNLGRRPLSIRSQVFGGHGLVFGAGPLAVSVPGLWSDLSRASNSFQAVLA